MYAALWCGASDSLWSFVEPEIKLVGVSPGTSLEVQVWKVAKLKTAASGKTESGKKCLLSAVFNDILNANDI